MTPIGSHGQNSRKNSVLEINNQDIQKDIRNSKVKISEDLYEKLERLAQIVDFRFYYINKEVAEIPSGRSFGELAHVLS